MRKNFEAKYCKTKILQKNLEPKSSHSGPLDPLPAAVREMYTNTGFKKGTHILHISAFKCYVMLIRKIKILPEAKNTLKKVRA